MARRQALARHAKRGAASATNCHANCAEHSGGSDHCGLPAMQLFRERLFPRVYLLGCKDPPVLTFSLWNALPAKDPAIEH